MNNIYQHNPLQERHGASLALTSSAPAKSDVVEPQGETTKRNVACRSENTGDGASPYIGNHTVFVLSCEGLPLSPTTSAKARKLIKGGQAKSIWSKFNTFGIQMSVPTGNRTPKTTLGCDPGSKFDGYSIVVGQENNLSIKIDLPAKKKIVDKLEERRQARTTRRGRLRRRPARFDNRKRDGWLAPSQQVILCSRLKPIAELCRIYPVSEVAIEDVCFNHAKHRWGKNFSTVEIGKTKLRQWFEHRNIIVHLFKGYETDGLRKGYGYKKSSSKSADKFTAHCSDSLTLAITINCGQTIDPGSFVVVDDTYRCVRRRLHDSNVKAGGVREKYSCGVVQGIQKGRIIGTTKGKTGQLCGEDRGSFRYYDFAGKRQAAKSLSWINNQLKVRSVPADQ